ncbi:hypothetical protein [Streptomyces sp. NPDC004721]
MTDADELRCRTGELLAAHPPATTERVLGLPAEPRTDKDVAWKDLAR